MAQLLSEKDPLALHIRQLARCGNLPHAVILSGTGDRPAAGRYLAAALLCQSGGERPCMACPACRKVAQGIHPDVITVRESDRRELAVDTVRALRQDVYIRPNEGARKVYLFADCGQLNERDQNVLLKIVEEGPPYAAFIFCAESAAALLPTIRSRCVELKLRGEDDAQPSDRALELCRAFAGGELLPVAELLVSLENGRIKREQLQSLLEDAWRIAAQALLLRAGKAPAAGAPDEAAAAMSRGLSGARLQKLTDCLRYYAEECRCNVGPGHVLGALIAQWETILG